jgi:hypothetical protein
MSASLRFRFAQLNESDDPNVALEYQSVSILMRSSIHQLWNGNLCPCVSGKKAENIFSPFRVSPRAVWTSFFFFRRVFRLTLVVLHSAGQRHDALFDKVGYVQYLFVFSFDIASNLSDEARFFAFLFRLNNFSSSTCTNDLQIT